MPPVGTARRPRTAALCTLALAWSLSIAQTVGAQPATGGEATGDPRVKLVPFDEAAKASTLDLDLAVPESPAFTALGLSPENVARPATPRQFAAAALTTLDRYGNFQAGVAIDSVPYLIIAGDALSLQEYQESPGGFNWRRQLARTQLSIATTKGTSDADESVRLGLGLRITPWSKGDPRMDTEKDGLISCLKAAAGTLPEPPGTQEMTEGTDFSEVDDEDESTDAPQNARDAYAKQLDAWEAGAIRASEACLAPAEQRLSQASAWDVGAAPTWIQKGGTRSNLSWDGATFWSSFAWNFAESLPIDEQATSRRPQLIAHARFRLDEQVASPAAPAGFLEQNSLLVGTRLRWGGDQITFSFEASYLWQDPDIFGSTSAFVGGLHSDIRLYDQTWLSVALGGSAGGGDERIVLGATLKWGGGSLDLAQLVGGRVPDDAES